MVKAYDAVITDIFRQNQNCCVTIRYNEAQWGRIGEERSIVLLVNQGTKVVNEDCESICPGQLRIGMTVNATCSDCMTMSIPPQSQAYCVKVVNCQSEYDVTEGRIVEVGCNGKYILVSTNEAPEQIVRCNINCETVIIGPYGIRLRTCNLFPALLVTVEHATCMSTCNPPQTTAFLIEVET